MGHMSLDKKAAFNTGKTAKEVNKVTFSTGESEMEVLSYNNELTSPKLRPALQESADVLKLQRYQ